MATVDPLETRRAILLELQTGSTMRSAAERMGIALSTLKRWRRQDATFDALVLAAVTASGRTIDKGRAPRPLERLQCPGDRCGTTTGYDYGCRGQPCVSAKSAVVVTARRRQ